MRKKKRKIKEIKNVFIFGACAAVSGAATMLGINALPVMATEDVGEEVTIGENMEDGTAGKLSENSQVGVTAERDDLGVYDFKDNKTTGTVTVTKEWSEMFHGCSSLTSLDLTPLNTAKVTNMESMFYRCSGLTSLDLTPLNTANVTNMSSMFYDCSGLTTIKTGVTFKFARTDYFLSGTWRNVIGETFNGDYGTANFPSNVADTYTKIS